MVENFLVVLLTTIICACFMGIMFYIGFTFGRNYPKDNKVAIDTLEKDRKKKLQEEEARRRNQGLNNIIDYDIDVAMGRREQID